MHRVFNNVNNAFRGMVHGVHTGDLATVRRESRNGPVLMIPEPVIVTYEQPCQRVLFNRARDCNPFFHLFESLWMLAGGNDVESLAYFNSQIANYSDNGTTFWGAYGHRWRSWFEMDQLDWIVDRLQADFDDRRIVLSMWDPGGVSSGDLYRGGHGGKDVPCNTHAYFSIRRVASGIYSIPHLDMTVCNRSNDMIWGMLGANAVHFSFLQEYLARRIEVAVGHYHQFTNNLHVYESNWKPKEWLAEEVDRDAFSPPRINYNQLRTVPLISDAVQFDREVCRFMSDLPSWADQYREPFLEHVARPMCRAYAMHKQREYAAALDWMQKVGAEDWQIAGTEWIKRRQQAWEAKHVSARADEA